MSFDLDKLQAVAELGEVIRLQNEALERLAAFRKARPHMMMPNLAKMVEENIKENVQVLYKELNNLHKPAEQQTRYICDDCKMAFLVRLPGGLCDECRARRAGAKPRTYISHAEPLDMNAPDDGAMLEESDSGLHTADDLTDSTLSEQAADEVAEDLSVAEAMPEENIAGELVEPESDDSVYELSMEDSGDFKFDAHGEIESTDTISQDSTQEAEQPEQAEQAEEKN